jgi:hypothetical protein
MSVSGAQCNPKREAYSSPLRNSAVKNKCSRERVADKTPPNNSVSLTVFNADPCSVDYNGFSSNSREICKRRDPP